MTRRAPLALLLVAAPASLDGAAGLSLVKTVTVIDDQVSVVNPRALPGAVVEYRITASNPLLAPGVGAVQVTDVFVPAGAAATVRMRVADDPGGGGPVRFGNVNLLGVSLSGVSFRYDGLTSPSDGLEFFDGASWAYQPVADADGYDVRVRGIRVTLSGQQVAGGAFRLSYRVQLR